MMRRIWTGLFGVLATAAFAQAQTGTAGTNPDYRRGNYSDPWFGAPGVRQQLNLTDEQFDRLNKIYGPAYTTLGASLQGTTNLTEQERLARQTAAYTQFYQTLGSSYKNVLTPEQQARFNQLWMQYRGYDALLDPATRAGLNLTDAQLQQIRQYDTEYQRQMTDLMKQYGTNRGDAISGYNKLQPQIPDRINQVLNEQQRRLWTEQTGSPYRFEPFYGYVPGPNPGPGTQTPPR